MKKHLLLGVLFVGSLFTANAQVTQTFTDLELPGGQFITLALPADITGTLTSVTINATLTASAGDTYASDLTIYAAEALAPGGALQVGGDSDLEADQRFSWADGAASTVGTPVTGTITITTPVNFTGANLSLYLGNGYLSTTASGTWSGEITFNGVTFTPLSGPKANLDNEFSISPNPATNVVNVTNANNAVVNSVAIVDLNGRTVKSVTFNGGISNAQVNVSDLSAGIYMITVTSDKGSVTKKIVKN